MVDTKYFIVNKKHNIVGGCDYRSYNAAKKSIPTCNIPNADAEVFKLEINFLNDLYVHPEKYHTNQNRIRRLMK